MARMGNDLMASGAGMSPRKAIASGMGPGSSNFGVGDFERDAQKSTKHPDHTARTGSKKMDDGSRGIGTSVSRGKSQHGAQAAPDHGPTHPGGHGMHKGYANKI